MAPLKIDNRLCQRSHERGSISFWFQFTSLWTRRRDKIAPADMVHILIYIHTYIHIYIHILPHICIKHCSQLSWTVASRFRRSRARLISAIHDNAMHVIIRVLTRACLRCLLKISVHTSQPCFLCSRRHMDDEQEELLTFYGHKKKKKKGSLVRWREALKWRKEERRHALGLCLDSDVQLASYNDSQ